MCSFVAFLPWVDFSVELYKICQNFEPFFGKSMANGDSDIFIEINGLVPSNL
jgi:hypothetical protein